MANFLRCLVVFLAAALTHQEAVAQALTVTPVGLSITGPSGGGLSGMATYQATSGSGVAANSAYYSRAVSFSQGQVANAARARAVPGVGAGSAAAAAAISAAMLGAGYLLDQYTGQINSAPAIAPVPIVGSIAHCVSGPNPQKCRPGYAAWVGKAHPTNPSIFFTSVGCPDSAGSCNGLLSNSGNATIVRVTNYPTNAVNADTGTAAVPATDPQVALAIQNNPATWPDLFVNPNTGAVQNTGPVADAGRALYNELAPSHGIDPAVTPQPNPTVGEQTGDQPAPTDLPAFCTWASKVCQFIDWVKAPDDADGDVELPVKEIAPATFVSGIGNGSCPAPYTIALSSGSFQLSFATLCDFANRARSIVILFAFLAAAYILVGAKN